jgi:hypothetical protein
MISRCPSCGTQVDDEAQQCPKCYWDFVQFKCIPPPGHAAPPAKEPAPAAPQQDFSPEPELPASAFAAVSSPEPQPAPAPDTEPEPEPTPLPPPVQLPPIGNPEVPQLPAAPPPAHGPVAARPASGTLAMPMFGKMPETPALSPDRFGGSSLPSAPPPPRPVRKEEAPPRAAVPIAPAIPKAPASPSRSAPPAPQKKAAAPAEELAPIRPPRPAEAGTPPLTVIQSGTWGSASGPSAPAARPAVAQPATVQPKPARGRSPLLNRVTAGVVVLGVLFVIAMQFVMRSDVEVGGRHSALPNFAKDSRPQPLQLPMPSAAAAAPLASAPSANAALSTAAAVAPPAEPVRPPAAAAAAPAEPSAPPAKSRPVVVLAKSARAPKPAPRPKEPALQWTFAGSAYDIISLRPVFAAALAFKDASGKVRGETSTAEDGSYSISLDPLSGVGYVLAVRHVDYQERYIDEINPPFKEVSVEERRALVGMAARARPWVGSTAKVVHRDFVMLPRDPAQKGDPESPAPAAP